MTYIFTLHIFLFYTPIFEYNINFHLKLSQLKCVVEVFFKLPLII